jgi:hypothetical protein
VPQRRGPRPDPGTVGGQGQILRSPADRKMDRLKAQNQLQAEKKASLEKQIREHPITQRRERTQHVREATAAIKAGRAEAHPRVTQKGFIGEIEMPVKEARDVGKTFSESLQRSSERRRKASRPGGGMGYPPRGADFAAVRKPTRKPVRRASRMSGSGR